MRKSALLRVPRSIMIEMLQFKKGVYVHNISVDEFGNVLFLLGGDLPDSYELTRRGDPKIVNPQDVCNVNL